MKKIFVFILAVCLLSACSEPAATPKKVEAATKAPESQWIILNAESSSVGSSSETTYRLFMYHKKTHKVFLEIHDTYSDTRAGGGVAIQLVESNISLTDARELYGDN
jgi:hypothetical protein